MDFIESLLAGIGVRCVQRPLVFISMGVATLFFAGIAVVVLVMTGVEFGHSDDPLALVTFGGGIAILFGGLAAVSGYMVKRCFDPGG